MRRGWLTTAIVLLLVASGSYGIFRYLDRAGLPEGVIYGNGHIEATEVRVAAEIAGVAELVELVEGEPVAAGELIVKLDDTEPELAVKTAKAAVEALKNENDALKSEAALWRHHKATAERDLERLRNTLNAGGSTRQQIEKAGDVVEEASRRLEMLVARSGVTAARLDAARGELARAEYRLGKTSVHAPGAGTVLTRGIEPGEFATPGTVVAVLADLSEVELRVFLTQSGIGRIALGDPVRVRVDGRDGRAFLGRVARIDARAQFTPRAIHMPEERERLVYGVTLLIENPDGALKPGMPADAWILWDEASGWPDEIRIPG